MIRAVTSIQLQNAANNPFITTENSKELYLACVPGAINAFLTCFTKGNLTRKIVLDYVNNHTLTFTSFLTGDTFSFNSNGDIATDGLLGRYTIDAVGLHFKGTI